MIYIFIFVFYDSRMTIHSLTLFRSLSKTRKWWLYPLSYIAGFLLLLKVIVHLFAGTLFTYTGSVPFSEYHFVVVLLVFFTVVFQRHFAVAAVAKERSQRVVGSTVVTEALLLCGVS